MARQTAHYIDPEEERRREELLAELGGGNLGVAPAPRIPLSPADLTTPRMTDRAYPPVDDAWNRAEPSPQDLAADAAAEEEAGADVEAPETPKTLLSRNPYDDAPAAIDQRAASVSAEQKGTPATAVDLGWADELLAGVKQRMLDTPPLSQMDYSHAADQFIDPAAQKGERSDLLGFDDEEGFSRQKQIERARAAYGEDTPPSSRWEEEFLQNHKRISDADVQRSFILQALAGGQEAGLAFRESMLRQQAGQEEGLAKARERDRANTRIDRGLAEAIAATGNVSPEQAAQLTYGHPLVKAFSSGMYSQGGRAEGQALGLNKEKLNIISRLRQHIDNGDLRGAMALLSSATQLGTAQTYATKDKPQAALTEGAVQPPTQTEVIASNLFDSYKLPFEVAMQAAQGDLSNVPEHLRDNVRAAVIQNRQNVNTKEGMRAITAGPRAAEARGDIAATSSAKSARAKQPFSMTAGKERTAVRTLAATVKRARESWAKMSPEARDLFVQVGPDTPEAFANAYASITGMKPYQAEATNLRALNNEITRQMAGLSQTNSEMQNQLKQSGLAAGYWDPFKSTDGFSEALDRIQELTRLRYQSMKEDGSWDASEPQAR